MTAISTNIQVYTTTQRKTHTISFFNINMESKISSHIKINMYPLLQLRVMFVNY